MASLRTNASKHEYNPMASFETTVSKYCLLFFMHRNKIGLLKRFAKTNKCGGLNRRRGGEKKI